MNDGEKLPKKESDRRKKLKNELGKMYPGKIMLDSNSSKAYRDAIICVKDTGLWKESFMNLYKKR